LELVRDALFPELCFACKKELADGDRYICSSCAGSMGTKWQTVCPVCYKAKTFKSPSFRCAHAPSPLASVSFLFHFSQPTVRALIHTLKYSYIKESLLPLSYFFEKERLNILRIPADIIVPMPLTKRRERERGFNQASLLAAAVSAVLFAPVSENVLSRSGHAKAQIKTGSRKERMENIKGVFKMSDAARINGKTVLLVDDVMTTGATLTEAAYVLERAGARRVHAFVLAREE